MFLRTAPGDVHSYFTANADGSNESDILGPGEYCCLNRMSPDRKRMLVMPTGDITPPVTGGILSVDGTGFQMLQLSDPTLNLVPQAWSPDGSHIAFEGWEEGNPRRGGVYIGAVNVETGAVTDVQRVTSSGGAPHDMPLDFSPDGQQLVFYRAVRAEPDFPTDTGGALWVVNIDGSGAHELDTPPPNWWARWSPDGQAILFPSERNQPTGTIWSIRPDGSGLTTVFEDPNGGFPIDPIWSPDGSQIMFMLDPISDRFTHPDNVVCVIRADGSDLTTVIDTPDFKSSPEWWSP
jgi:Tol biopolymer transport system component